MMAMVAITLFPMSGFAQPEDHERYYVVMLDGQRTGWMRESTRVEDEKIVSEGELTFQLKRGTMELTITMASTFEETIAHEPLRMTSTQSMGAMPVTTEVVFHDETMEVSVTQNGQTNTQSRPLPEGKWLTPAAAEEFVRRRLESGAESISVRTIEPMAGVQPVVTTYTDFAEETIEVFGRDVHAIRATLEQSIAPGMTSTEHMDHEGRLLRSFTPMGGMQMTVLAADKALAMADLDPPELMQSTFVTPKGELRHPRRTTRATYMLRVPEGDLQDLPELPSQRTERIDEQTVRLFVTMGDESVSEEHPGEAYLASSTMLDTSDPAILELAKKAVSSDDAADEVRAEAMRRAVFRHIKKKNLGVGIATASEVARTGVGDCTEHGTLLAAMLRTAGIPSRTVSGLVFVENFEGSEDIFGYHMWTQAWIENDSGKGRWVDFDATLGPNTPFDATHIALATSDMSDDEATNSMITLVPLLGALEIEIEEAQ